MITTPEYKIVYTPPPIYPELREKWGVKWEDGVVVMVYGDTIHQSFKQEMDKDLLVHELVHVKQHKAYPGGPKAWWRKYIDDQDFRIAQELEAYRTQYKWCQENVSRQVRKAILKHCAKDLSSFLYGNVMSFDEAENLIKQI